MVNLDAFFLAALAAALRGAAAGLGGVEKWSFFRGTCEAWEKEREKRV